MWYRPLSKPRPSAVLGLYSGANANAWYRVVTPMRAIGGSWARIDMVSRAQLEAAETVVIHGQGGSKQDVHDTMVDLRDKWGIQRIYVDYDDALFHPHPVKDVRLDVRKLAGVREALKRCDGVIVTSEGLQDHFADHTDKPITVIPNLIYPEDWPVAPPADNPPVIVLAGSPSHADDWNLVVPVMAQIRKQLPDVQFRLMGYGHPQLKQIATQGGGGWRGGMEYRNALIGGAIGLCPLLDTPFNRGKSPIKAIEYNLAAGMAVVGSPTQYEPLLSDDRGMIARSTVGWLAGIASYLTQPAVRQADADRLRSYILDQFNAHTWADRIRDAYAMEVVCQSS